MKTKNTHRMLVSLWPAMAINIDLDRIGHPRGLRYPLFDLVRDNTLVARNTDRITVGEVHGTDTAPITFLGR